MYENELKHYGVLGMKWGIRRARRKQAKADYEAAKQKYRKELGASLDRHDARVAKAESNGKKMSRDAYRKSLQTQVREADKAKSDYKQAKMQYKIDKTSKAKDVEIANKLYSKQSKKANAAIANMSAGETFIQYSLMGSYGALKYNEAKAKGTSTGRAVAEGILYSIGDDFVYGALSTAQYLDNRAARKK